MTRTRWLIAGLWLLAFWLAAALIVAPKLELSLAETAHRAIQSLPTGYQPAEVQADGQYLKVSGQVRREGQRQEIVATLRQKLRGSGLLSATGWNPVQAVQDDLRVVPYPPGWLMVAAHGARGQLLGVAATDYEARDLATWMAQKWSEKGGYLDPRVSSDPDLHDEAPEVQAMLAKRPMPRTDISGDSAQIQLARIGGEWQRLVLDAKDENLHKQVLALGIEQPDWEKTILPAIKGVRHYQAEQRAKAAEAERQSKLPPPHLFLAAREHRLLVRGEVATLPFKREFLNTLIAAFPDWRILDDVRVNEHRRAATDFGPITDALLPPAGSESPQTAGKSLMLGLPGAAWQRVDFLVGGDAQPWKDLLPSDLPAMLLQDDSRMVVEWLQGSTKGIPKLPMRLQPSYVTMTLLPDKVILAGQLAEEPARTQLIESARQKYAGRAVVIAEQLLARGTCEPSGDLQQTLRSLPDLPAADSQGLVAFCRPGQVWKSQGATEKLLQPGTIATSGLLPADFPAAMAENSFLEGYEHLRHHWKSPAPTTAPEDQEQSTETTKPKTAN